MSTFIRGISGVAKKFAVGSADVKKIYLGSTKIYDPSEYDSEIEYLQSSGTQWIDTGIIPTSDTKIQFKFKNLAATGDNIIGYQHNNDQTDWRFFNYSSKAYFDAGQGQRIYGGSIYANTVYELELGNYYVKNLVTGYNIISGSTYSASGIESIKLNKGISACSKNTFYYVKIYNGNTLVRDMIPVRIGQIGYLFDRVSEQFFGNLGSGNFILGADIQ